MTSLLDINDRLGTHPDSWYAASSAPIGEFPAAQGDLTYDVAIVGGGFSGLSTALHLAESGYKVCILEAHRIGWGASGRNGGQVGSGQRIENDELEKLVGFEHAKRAYDIGCDAAKLVRALISKHKIACAYKEGSIQANHRKRFDAETEEYVQWMADRYGSDHYRYISPEEMSEKVGSNDYSGGMLDRNAGHLHPLNFARGLATAAIAAGAEVFETSRVMDIAGGKPCKVTTSAATITCKHVVLAANGYLGHLDRRVADRVMPINNFIVATEPLNENTCHRLIKDGECVHDTRFVVNYFRISEDKRLLFGGGENYTYKFPRDIRATVKRPMLKVFPELKDVALDYAWGGTLGITYQRLPDFEFRKDGIVCISGYSGSGVHMATMAGKIAADAINGQMAQFDVMSSLPTPKFPGGARLRWPLLPLALTWYAMLDRL